MKDKFKDGLIAASLLVVALVVYALGSFAGYRRGYQDGTGDGKKTICSGWAGAYPDPSTADISRQFMVAWCKPVLEPGR